ncbi:MAG: transcription accessory protein [Gammaproteobacteria bacterium SG8_11]|nr:MAG: transcription accessory protein [Gammaproteobacteria bacterium SG8_11]
MKSINQLLAEELQVKQSQIDSAVALMDDGATVPFIARYRKEATGGLDDGQLRRLEERLNYLRELDERRQTVLKSISEQGKLTPDLEKSINTVTNKTELEDLYRPYMPKRRTKAQIAREAGLEPLALSLLQNPSLDPHREAQQYLNPEKEIKDADAALDGAKQIVMEIMAEDASLLGQLRQYAWDHGVLLANVVKDKEKEGAKFSDYFAFSENIKSVPSHRALALFRGQKEGILHLRLSVDPVDENGQPINERSVAEGMIAKHFNIANEGRPADDWLMETVHWAWRVKLSTHLDLELKRQLREAAESEAINVFARNLKNLLLAAPAGHKVTIGLDPGIRTGVKVAVVDNTGKLLETATIYPHEPRNQWKESIAIVAKLAQKHHVQLIAIGNGTASRETDKLAGDIIKQHPELHLSKIMISEAGASVYSASELAAAEFPDLDVSLRGAVSIARRLQDPLAELVKIDPKSIGVGQYQHDVNQVKLSKSLDNVVEDCVNAVGVDLNTASIALLKKVSGLNGTLAQNIVHYRDNHGAFKTRDELLQVPRLGPKAYEQSAGFLRIVNGVNPLDASAVHPEAYPVIKRIIDTTGQDIRSLIGNTAFLRKLSASSFTDEQFGEPTVKDIISELEKPGRDPRPEFKTAEFKEGVDSIADLNPGMRLQGVVTNVTNFGAFVDIGVHQDGLVHISELSDNYVSNPLDVVKAGDLVHVNVLDVDVQRKRIGLSMKQTSTAKATGEKPVKSKAPKNHPTARPKDQSKQQPLTAMAAALSQLRLKK